VVKRSKETTSNRPTEKEDVAEVAVFVLSIYQYTFTVMLK